MTELTCYLTHSAATDVSLIIRVLEENGVELTYPLLTVGTPASESVLAAIRSCSFVCAVVSERTPPVFFDLGVAMGLGKPILLVQSGETPDFLLPLRDNLVIRATPGDSEAIRFAVEPFIDRLGATITPTRQPISSSVSVVVSDRTAIHATHLPSDPLALEVLLAQVFKKMPGVLAVTKRTADNGIDMGLWVDGLEQSVGNPILVQVKVGALTRDRLWRGIDDLRAHIGRGSGQVGLLLYTDIQGNDSVKDLPISSAVFCLSVQEFLQALTETSLAHLILEWRNRAVHGGL